MKDSLRPTKQRKMILETLRGMDTHPTADEVYSLVRKRYPEISLGTVYRNLEAMAERGIIKKISLSGTRMRFDRCTDKHYHLRCADCGRVQDLKMEPLSRLERQAARISGYLIRDHYLEFSGLCPQCRKKRNSRQEQETSTNNGQRKRPKGETSWN